MAFLFLLGIVAIIGFRLTTGADRKRLLEKAVVVLRELAVVAREEYGRLAPFRAALRARTAWALLVPALVAANLVVFFGMAFGAGAMSDLATLVSWGANYGPRTTNGEWWRLLTSVFVHTGLVRLVIETAVLAQLGLLLERLAGRAAVAAVFCVAGVLAALMNVSAFPMAATAGTSGSIFGLYGLLLAALARSLQTRRVVNERLEHEEANDLQVDREGIDPGETDAAVEEVPADQEDAILVVPKWALIWLAPTAVLFILSAWSNDGFTFKANMAGFAFGIAAGLALTGGIAFHATPLKPVLVTSAVGLAAIAALAIPMRGITDVRPEIARIVALEDRTAGAYQDAVERVRRGKMTTDALAQLIDRTIVPDLETANAHLRAIRGVPAEQQHLVTDADEYLRLRTASWRLYADDWRNKVRAPRREADGTLTSDAGWRQLKARFRADAATRGKAEGTERAALEAFQKLKGKNSPPA